MTLAGASARYYSDLPVSRRAVADLLGEPGAFTPVPADWQVLISDVRGSTRAWSEGRHQEVNLVATGSIIAALNLAHRVGITLPFYFGGDGATLLTPPGLADPIEQALLAHRANTQANLDLDLRVGRIAVADLLADGHALSIARAEISPGLVIPVTLGDALAEAERRIKGRDVEPEPPSRDAPLDLEGMACRWDSIRPPQDTQEVVCLLVVVREPSRQAALLAEVLSHIDTIYGPLDRRTPIARPRMKVKPTLPKVATEMRVRLGHFDLGYLVSHWLKTMLGPLWFRFTADGSAYLDQLVQLSDTLMIDGRINTVMSGTARQRDALADVLQRMEDAGGIVYGMQVCQASVMSCYVRDRRDQHIHFVDGLGGGYTQAATVLKRKLAAA